MNNLRKHFVTTTRPYREGTVEVFEQKIKSDRLKKATLQITALGVYCAEINGKKVGDIHMAPGFTYYPKNLHFQEYDISEQLTGDDTLTVYLAQGWYCGRFGFKNKTRIYGEKPAVSWIIAIEDSNGSTEYCSDSGDVRAVTSPYEYAGLYDGEIYRSDGFDATAYPPVKYRGRLPDVIEKSDVYVRLRENMPIKEITKKNGKTVLDFGQNFAGVAVIDPAKINGVYIKLRHGEILDENGEVYTKNLRKAKAEIVYYKGKNSKKFVPQFTYMGFRYIEISGCDYQDGLIEAYAVYSDMERTGYFTCDNYKINRLFENQVWGQKSNYVEVPTDCPQRDERMGYTGDGLVFAQTGAYNFDTERFWKKFLKDIRYSQSDNKEGYVTATVPSTPVETWGFANMLGWGNCVCIVPEMLYRQYGSVDILKTQYKSMKAFVECEIKHMGKVVNKDLWIGVNLGDWLAYEKSPLYIIRHNNPVSNAFVVNDLRIMAWAAKLLGYKEEASRYEKQLEKTRAAYMKRFISNDGRISGDYQGAYVMALKMVIPKGKLWDKMFGILTQRLRKDGMLTGFFSTQHLLPLLVDNGETQLAFDILFNEKCPGWLYQVNCGATTIWERWDSLKPDGRVNLSMMGLTNMVSFNHYAYGSVGEFFYRYILGIQALKPAFSEIEIKPHIDRRLGSYCGEYKSRNGTIRVSFESGTRLLTVNTPVKAEIILPDGERKSAEKGEYTFEIKEELL